MPDMLASAISKRALMPFAMSRHTFWLLVIESPAALNGNETNQQNSSGPVQPDSSA
jgi:hypothetical protein